MAAASDIIGAWFSDPLFTKEVVKIVLDKFLFALVLLVAGLYLNRLLEKYKSTQSIIQEQQKILFPQALQLIDGTQELTKTYRDSVFELSSLVSDVNELILSVLVPKLNTLDEAQLPKSFGENDSHMQIIDIPMFGGKSLRSLIVAAAATEEIKEHFLGCSERKRDNKWRVKAMWARLERRFGRQKGLAIRKQHHLLFFNKDDSRAELVSRLKSLRFLSINNGVVNHDSVGMFWPGFMYEFGKLYFDNLGLKHIERIMSEYEKIISSIEEIPLIHMSARDAQAMLENIKLGTKLSNIPDIKLLRDFYFIVRMNLELFPTFKVADGMTTQEIILLGDTTQIFIRRSIRRMLLPSRTFW